MLQPRASTLVKRSSGIPDRMTEEEKKKVIESGRDPLEEAELVQIEKVHLLVTVE